MKKENENIVTRSDAGNSTSEKTKVETLKATAAGAFGLTEQDVVEAKAGCGPRMEGNMASNRHKVQNAICEHAKAIMEDCGGAELVCARTVGEYLQSRGLIRTATGAKYRHFYAIGDMLGEGGLKLPKRRLRQIMRYDLASANADSATKALRQQQLLDLEPNEILALKLG